MTSKGAIYVLKHTRLSIPNETDKNHFIKAVRRAIVALEKQIAKKPKCDDDLDTIECPSCKEVFYSEYGYMPKYCTECGQKYDWSENDEE